MSCVKDINVLCERRRDSGVHNSVQFNQFSLSPGRNLFVMSEVVTKQNITTLTTSVTL